MEKTSWLSNPGLTLICRVLAGGVFLAAAVSKIGDPVAFSTVVTRYELFPSLANIIAITFPWMELVLAVCVLFGVWPRAAALGICMMLAIFLPALIYALAQGLKIDCGCFGTNEPLTPWTVVRDLSVALPALQVLFSKSELAVLARG